MGKISDPTNATIYKNWLTREVVNILKVWKKDWRNYTSKLEKGHIRLIEEPDEILWNYKEGGSFTTKLGYISLSNLCQQKMVEIFMESSCPFEK